MVYELMRLLAIDPGPTKSAYIIFDTHDFSPKEWGKIDNPLMFYILDADGHTFLVLEKLAYQGRPAGRDTLDTALWSGRFLQVWNADGAVYMMPRSEVKKHLLGRATGTDTHIRQAIIDRYGGDQVAKGVRCKRCYGKGWRGRDHAPCDNCTKGWEVPKGPLRGVAADVWQALALAITYTDLYLHGSGQ